MFFFYTKPNGCCILCCFPYQKKLRRHYIDTELTILSQLELPLLVFATGDLLPVFLARYRRLIACFSGPLQETIACFSGPSSLTFSAKSAILELKGGENENFTLCMMFRKGISFIYEKIYFGDRVPLNGLNKFSRMD